jgi:hypothetical protein
VLLGSGCRASASASINTGQKEENFDEDPGTMGDGEAEEPAEPALLGARHDLHLKSSAAATCSCLAVALGGPADASFAWDGQVPSIDPQTQLVIAVSSEGVACTGAPKDSLGASYWGYRQSGDDVIVIVENARFGRPLTAGAIIPKPIGNGQVYVRNASNGVPYGKPLNSADKLCRIGNPGPARGTAATGTSDVSEEENW